MGFRAVIRCLLVFFDYYQILRYLAVIVLTLWCATICSIARHMDTKAAFLFAVSIVLVRPQVVVMSLQFSCCFIIAFCAMLLIPRLAATSGKDGPFFFMIGIITMYFDFYTTPTLTLCLPMMYLFILRQKEGTAGRFRLTDACRCVLLWGVGYLGMWFAKMVLTTVFTDQNGLQNGIQAMLSHLRGERLDGLTGRYTLLDSIYVVWYALSCDTAGKWVVLLSGFMGIIWILTSAIRAHIVFSDLKGLSVLFLLTAIPIIWMLAAPKVIYIHYWFQYRSIAASFWGVGLCCMTIFKRARCRKRQGTNAAFRQSNNTSS